MESCPPLQAQRPQWFSETGPQGAPALPPVAHLPLGTVVLFHPPDEIRFSLQVLLILLQGHVPFLHQDVWHMGFCTDEINTQPLPGCEGHSRGCRLGVIFFMGDGSGYLTGEEGDILGVGARGRFLSRGSLVPPSFHGPQFTLMSNGLM